MIRTTRWKLTIRHPNGPDELYDMKKDPEEAHNLIGETAHDKTESELRERLNEFFRKYADPKYDRWKGGKTKGMQILNPLSQ